MTNIQEFLDIMKEIQEKLLNYIDSDENVEENYQNLIKIFNEKKVQDDQSKLKPILYLILQLSNYHIRSPLFYDKIDKLLHFFKDDMLKYYSNLELFYIFKKNRRLLLFLINEGIIKIDKTIAKLIVQIDQKRVNYIQYFYPILKPILGQKYLSDKLNEPNKYHSDEEKVEIKPKCEEFPENFNQNLLNAENESVICSLIRQDLIVEFITYVNKINISLSSQINLSIFESNPFLYRKVENINPIFIDFYNIDEMRNPSLIEYAAFNGAFQIFNYLRMNKIELKPSLWLNAIHGKNEEIIFLLEENNILPNDKSFNECIEFALRCHHNEIAKYLIEKYLKPNQIDIFSIAIKYFNFEFIKYNDINDSQLYKLGKYDYYALVNLILKSNKDIDVNITEIFISLFIVFSYNGLF